MEGVENRGHACVLLTAAVDVPHLLSCSIIISPHVAACRAALQPLLTADWMIILMRQTQQLLLLVVVLVVLLLDTPRLGVFTAGPSSLITVVRSVLQSLLINRQPLALPKAAPRQLLGSAPRRRCYGFCHGLRLC